MTTTALALQQIADDMRSLKQQIETLRVTKDRAQDDMLTANRQLGEAWTRLEELRKEFETHSDPIDG